MIHWFPGKATGSFHKINIVLQIPHERFFVVAEVARLRGFGNIRLEQSSSSTPIFVFVAIPI